jgi:hypothetical protein
MTVAGKCERIFKRHFSCGHLLVHHGETDYKTRHDEEHVYANETATEHPNAQMAQHHQRDRYCTQELNFLAYAMLRIHYNSVVERLVTQRAAE